MIRRSATTRVNLTATAALVVLVAAAAGCGNRQNQVIPNRVLDRPLDVALACVRHENGTYTPQSLEQCSDAVAESVCGDLRLVGFVANSERNDIAMFSRCAGSVIDMNISAPGPQLISGGEVPSSMTATTGLQAGCFAISGNLGSCDLSVLDVGGLAAYAFEEPPEDDPAAYVSTVVPRRADGTPLGARPGQVLAVPPDLSNSGEATLGCDPANPGSVYVTFPSCQLIAEVDLRTQRILQSRQFVRDPDNGAITVVDTGADPVCPVDCAEQFLEPEYADALASAPAGDPDGMYPLAMALVSPPSDPTGCVDAADLMIEDHSLYVGGLGSDTIFELRFDGKTWTDDPLEFELPAAQGISVIRPTPAMEMLSGDVPEPFQFLYVLAGDGSTRVIRRDFSPNRTELGSECDTQVDPTAVTNTACHPAEFPGENPPDRRPFARGPGIRGPNGSLITDWTFQKWYDPTAVEAVDGSYDRCPSASADTSEAVSDNRVISSPFTGPGVVGVATTSFGRLIFGVFDQFQGRSGVSDTYDYLGVLDAQVPPHSLWPNVDPTLPSTSIENLPRMEDKEPERLLPGGVTDPTVTRTLAPSLRRIDRAYQTRVSCENDNDCDDVKCIKGANEETGYCEQIGPALSPPVSDIDQDRLARAEEQDDVMTSGLYVNDVVRAVVRDYPTWGTGTWNLFWEGEIPGTTSSSGQLVCEEPGWEAGTCLSTEAGDTRLVDKTAQFCERGVLGGDKLFILGCSADTDCGAGQYCLLDPDAPANSPGLCVSEVAYDASREQLLQICRPFLRDDCGGARREFAITRAFQQELWLQVLDKPVESYVMMRPEGASASMPATDEEREALCRGDHVAGRTVDGEPTCARRDDEPNCGQDGEVPCCSPGYGFVGDPGFVECEARLSCGPAQPDNGCANHSDCAVLSPDFPLCIDGQCTRPCGPDEDCALTPLPGPACFRELIRYQVLARNSFVVRGTTGAFDFLPQKVKADPDSGECYEDPEVSNLLTSRIRLGADEEDTRQNSLWPIPVCPAEAERPDGGAPNPCFIDIERPEALRPDTFSALYHFFSYGPADDGQRPVPAIRYSNPMMSFVLDLTSLLDLAAPIPGTEDALWPAEFADFKRSRIPGRTRESFGTKLGYSPYDAQVTTASVVLTGPTRIVNAPELSTVFVVDSSGGTTRGQVVRVTLAGGQVQPDVKFLVR
ncbi:hypothetical protein [Nannocystis sp. SCPEA4]|uniref:hypothetical protein n=1 Tax=Nannocystis sp. SCPEA4 TaxID=2996787 RepID=UPI00226FE4F1|nr:hypothetical protein [Nannocystis sp. SCPEA4]MCY1058140.1 hypothetical protein [Nannocystis sp. SCPEA4]